MYLETVRLLALSAVAVALALGGVAVAQPAGIVDPWSGSEQDSWFAPSKSEAAPAPTPDLIDPWIKPSDASQTPSIAPVSRAEPARAGVPVVVPLGSPADVSVVNPWAPPVAASELPSLRASAPLAVNRTPNTPWAPGFAEIVDPWKGMPEWAPSERVRLVLDPWAR